MPVNPDSAFLFTDPLMEKLTWKEITLLLTLALVQFTHVLDNMIMMPMAPNLKLTMNIDSQQFGFLVSSYGIAAFISAIAASFWADKFDRKKVLTFLYAFFLVGTAACGFAPNYESFIAIRFFTGLFGGIAGAVIMSIIGDVLPLEKRARGMGILMMGFSLASVVGVPLGIFLSEHYSWHIPFFMIAGIGFFVFWAIFFLIPPVNSHLQNTGAPRQNLYKAVFTNSNQVRALLFSVCLVTAHFMIIPYISDYLVNNNGFDMKTEVVFIYIIGGLLTVVSSPLIGKFADRYGRFKVYAILNVLAILPLILIPNNHSHSFWIMIGEAALFFIFSAGRMPPGFAIVTSAVEPRLRGGFMSLNSAAQQLAVAISTIAGGLIIQNDAARKLYHYEIVGYIAIGFTLLTFFLGKGVKAVGQK